MLRITAPNYCRRNMRLTEEKSLRHTLLGLLGLCPLLPLSGDWQTGLVLGLATLFLSLSCGFTVSLLRSPLADWSRWPALVLLLAIAVGLVEITMRAFAYTSWSTTAWFLPLLISNCLLLHGSEAGARQKPLHALRQALLSGSAMAVLLVAVGAARTGLPGDKLGATALIFAGLLLAAKNYLTRNADTGDDTSAEPPPPRRVRVTGPVR